MRHKNNPINALRAQSNRRTLTVKMNNFFEPDSKFIDTGTWPVKKDMKKMKMRKIRPLTATLDKPRLLDIALMGKIDMSRMTKELLSIYRIMRNPPKRTTKDSSDEENVTPIENKAKKEDKPQKVTVKLAPPIVWQRRGMEKFRRVKLDEAFSGPLDKPLVKPCDSCGRESRPERLHAHPPPTTKKNDTKQESARTRQSLAAKAVESPRKLISPEKQTVKSKSVKVITEIVAKKVDPKFEKPEKTETVMGVPLMCSYCGKRFGSASLAIHEAKCKDRSDSSDGGYNTSPTRRSRSPRRPLDHQKQPRSDDETLRPIQLNQLTVPVAHSPRSASSPRRISPSRRLPKGPDVPVATPKKSPKRNSEYNDYIFKGSGELDCEATFHNMWANHLRSLVMCQVCGRSFAPERIEKHQGVCNGSSRRLPSQKTR